MSIKFKYLLFPAIMLFLLAAMVGNLDKPLVREETPEVPTPQMAPSVTAKNDVSLTNPDLYGQYTVQRGDTLNSLGKSFGLSVTEIIHANPVLNSKTLQAGQVIVLPSHD